MSKVTQKHFLLDENIVLLHSIYLQKSNNIRCCFETFET